MADELVGLLASDEEYAMYERPGEGGEILCAVQENARRIAQLQAEQVRLLAAFVVVRPGREGREFSEFAPDELSAAMRWTRGYALARLRGAVVMTSHVPEVLVALDTGTLDDYQATVLADAVHTLPAEAAHKVTDYVLDRADGRNISELRRVIRRAVLRFDPRPAEARRARARQDRRVDFTPYEDGMAALFAYLPANEALTIHRRLDAFAREAAPGDSRTHTQRRADAFVDLMLDPGLGEISINVDVTVPASALTEPVRGLAGGPESGVLADIRSSRPPRVGPPCDVNPPHDSSARRTSHAGDGSSPGAAVTVSGCDPADRSAWAIGATCVGRGVPADGAAGIALPAGESRRAGCSTPTAEPIDAAGRGPIGGVLTGELQGYGTITAGQASELAAGVSYTGAAFGDPRWRRLVTNPVTGDLIEATPGTYRPAPRLAEFVRARDQACVFPGCSWPARSCDIDHRVPYPEGATSPDNLNCLCRRHHRLKHRAGWTLRKRGRSYVWLNPAGIEYVKEQEPVAEPAWAPGADNEPAPF